MPKTSKPVHVPRSLVLITTLAAITLEPAIASASSTGMPWESGLGTIAASLQGPVLRYTSVIGIIGFFIALALSGGHGGVVKGALTMGLIVCAAAAVPSVFLPMLGITGGLLI